MWQMSQQRENLELGNEALIVIKNVSLSLTNWICLS
jgi:hypothetical protein